MKNQFVYVIVDGDGEVYAIAATMAIALDIIAHDIGAGIDNLGNAKVQQIWFYAQTPQDISQA